MKTLRMSRAGAEWLVHDAGLTLSPASPFAFLLAAPPRTRPAERAAAAEEELFAAGVTFGAEEPTAQGAPFREGLELLTQPEVRIQVVTQAAGEAPVKMTLFARGGQAAAFVTDREAFHVGPRRALETTFGALQEQARSPRVLEGQQILFWPSVLEVLVMLWPRGGQDLDQSLHVDEALRRLGAPAVAPENAEAVLGELEEKGLLARERRTLAVASAYRPWLQAVLSGHRLQIDSLSLQDPEALEKADELTTRLLFLGPSGGRVLSRTLAGAELDQVLRGTAATEPRAIHVSALPPARLAELLRAHLGLAPAGA